MAKIVDKDKDGKPFPYYCWKFEGKVATIQTPLIERNKLPNCQQYLEGQGRQQYLLDRLKEWKEQGIEIVEFWVAKDFVDLAKSFFESVNIKMEVIKEEKEVFFCRLLL